MTIERTTLGGRVLQAAAASRSGALRYTLTARLVVDTLAITLALVVAVLGRNRLPVFSIVATVGDRAQSVGVLIALSWILLMGLFGAYAASNVGVGTLEYQRVLLASGTTAGLVGIACYLAKYQLSRGFFVILFLAGTALLILGRFTLRRVMHRLHRGGHLRTRVLLCGAPGNVDEIAAVLGRESWLGHNVVGAITSPISDLAETPAGVPVVGHSDDVVAAVVAQGADAVVFTEGSFPSAANFRRLAWALEEHKVQMIVVPSLTDVARERIHVRPVAGLPLVYVGSPQSLAAGRWMKRGFDVVGSSLLLVGLSPVMAAVAAWVRVHDRGRVLYRQTRVGRDGREFNCLKFRSMVPDAHQQVASLEDENHHDGPLFKVRDDPRVTAPGRFIRRFSLDELPQLVNVLTGDMSLVGPRPPLPEEVALYSTDAMRRLRVRPGMTGLWQVSGRADLSWDETVRLDLYYVDNWSIVQDVQIIGRTFWAVLSGRGAY